MIPSIDAQLMISNSLVSHRKPLEKNSFFSVLSDLLNSESVKATISQLCTGL